MKPFFLFLIISSALSLAYGNPVKNGQPGCKTEEEITVKYYRHFQKKIVYWECTALGEPAVLRSCPVAHGFLDAEKKCVHFSLWYWTPTVAPPSSPINEENINPGNNGQPGCKTEEELTVKYYRHFHNKTAYWECTALGEPATLRYCPVAHGFLDAEKKCVHFSLWYWTPTVAPPSSPISVENINPVRNGQPGCKTEEELTVKYYRHFHNKTAYWECTALGEPATLRYCPVAHGFLDAEKKCVHFSLWYWTPTVAPPSSPINVENINPVRNGQPGCKTEEEITVKYYRHFQKKIVYWECTALGEAAVLRSCPVAHGFLDAEKKCVHFSLWYWTPTVAPPSSPISVENSKSASNGQPGCKTEEELTVKYYRHFHNKTAYWECTALGEPATLRYCPVAHGFLDDERKCVHFSLWYWTPTVAPPSVPTTNFVNEA